LRDSDQSKIDVGNATMAFSASVIRLCRKFCIPVVLENPATSMLFRAPPICKQVSKGVKVNFDMCQFGTPWRKRTGLAGWKVENLSALALLCSGKSGLCKVSGKPHIVLAGHSREHKCLWTHMAQEYPPRFARAAAKILAQSYDSKLSRQRWEMFSGRAAT